MYIDEVKNNQFYQFPQWLLKEPYNVLSDKAKLIYMLLFDRRSLSLQNKWFDENGKVYMYFTNERFMELLNCSEKTIIKSKKELSNLGLLIEVRQGINKPNRLYINGTVKVTGQELNNLQYGTVKVTGQELNNLQGINTNNINTNISILNNQELELSDSNVTLTLPVTLHNATDIDIDKDIEIEEGEEEERKIQLAVQTYREMFGINSYLEQQNLIYDIEDASVDIYLEALKEATTQKAETPAYVRKVLRNWKSRGLDTVEKIENARIAFNTKKQNQKIPSKSNVPDWSNVNNPDYVEETLSPEEQEKAKQEMLERLNKLKKKEE